METLATFNGNPDILNPVANFRKKVLLYFQQSDRIIRNFLRPLMLPSNQGKPSG